MVRSARKKEVDAESEMELPLVIECSNEDTGVDDSASETECAGRRRGVSY